MLARRRIEGEDLVFLVLTDLAGVTRARAVPIADLPTARRHADYRTADVRTAVVSGVSSCSNA